MHVVGHHFQGQNLAIEFYRDFSDQRLQPHLDCAAEHLATVLGAPDEMIVDQRNRSRFASVLLHHELDYSTTVLHTQYNTPLSHPSKGWACGRWIFVTAYNNRGSARLDLGEYEQAIEDYTEAIRLDPSYALAYNNLGVAHKAQGNWEEAITDFRLYLELLPDAENREAVEGWITELEAELAE
jgi:tetratricopeptide (TPR) repeat protein